MRSSLEIESKLELSRSSFEHLLAQGQIRQIKDQLNIYYDNNWSLATRGSTFRVRFTPHQRPVVTLKIVLHSVDGVRTAREFENSLDQAVLGHEHLKYPAKHIDVRRELANGFRDELISIGTSTLSRVGGMRNKRYIVHFPSFGLAELDWVRLPNGQDFFEAEIETSDAEQRERVIAFVQKTAPDCRPSTLSKFERFQRAFVSRSAFPQGLQKLCVNHRPAHENP